MAHITGDFVNFENWSNPESVPQSKRLQSRLQERVARCCIKMIDVYAYNDKKHILVYTFRRKNVNFEMLN